MTEIKFVDLTEQMGRFAFAWLYPKKGCVLETYDEREVWFTWDEFALSHSITNDCPWGEINPLADFRAVFPKEHLPDEYAPVREFMETYGKYHNDIHGQLGYSHGNMTSELLRTFEAAEKWLATRKPEPSGISGQLDFPGEIKWGEGMGNPVEFPDVTVSGNFIKSTKPDFGYDVKMKIDTGNKFSWGWDKPEPSRPLDIAPVIHLINAAKLYLAAVEGAEEPDSQVALELEDILGDTIEAAEQWLKEQEAE